MPREEELPPSKRDKLSDSITEGTFEFRKFIEQYEQYNKMNDEDKLNFSITYFIKQIAIQKLQIEYLLERIEKVSKK
jgi:hypothetical protein